MPASSRPRSDERTSARSFVVTEDRPVAAARRWRRSKPRGTARWRRGRGRQGPAAGSARDHRRRYGRDQRGGALSRPPHRARPALRVRQGHPGGVPARTCSASSTSRRRPRTCGRLRRDLAAVDRLDRSGTARGLRRPARVLTMSYIHGLQITALGPLALNEGNGPAAGRPVLPGVHEADSRRRLLPCRSASRQHRCSLDDGRVAILDLGMIGRVGTELQQDLLSRTFSPSATGRSERRGGDRPRDRAPPRGLPWKAEFRTKRRGAWCSSNRDSTISADELRTDHPSSSRASRPPKSPTPARRSCCWWARRS